MVKVALGIQVKTKSIGNYVSIKQMNMKNLLIIFALSVMVFACRPTRKVQKIETAISKKDTTTVVVINTNTDKNADSIKMVKNLLGIVTAKHVDFKTFKGKAKVEYESNTGGDKATANFRILKDSIIWVSLTGPLGIEGFRLLITKDSVKLMNMLKKTIEYRSIDYLQDLTQIPFDFITLQNLIVGNPVLIDSNIVYYKDNEDQLSIMMAGPVFKHLININKKNNTLINSKLDDADASRNRTCLLSYSDYESIDGKLFSTTRKISVSEKSRIDVELDFKQYAFNADLTFPFIIPKNYKRK